jgi:hypothetical protein
VVKYLTEEAQHHGNRIYSLVHDSAVRLGTTLRDQNRYNNNIHRELVPLIERIESLVTTGSKDSKSYLKDLLRRQVFLDVFVNQQTISQFRSLNNYKLVVLRELAQTELRLHRCLDYVDSMIRDTRSESSTSGHDVKNEQTDYRYTIVETNDIDTESNGANDTRDGDGDRTSESPQSDHYCRTCL